MEELTDEELSGLVLKCAFAVHTELGPGLLESVYQRCLAYELRTLGYMKFSGCKRGLILNFMEARLKNGIKRLLL